ncbi:fungal-specific transcription factor domain-containing protein [Mycena galopus ATCC 62051]|nr:fungal-specific transcription factor domain-containing protein [Mycena galopus ATCC 62051]
MTSHSFQVLSDKEVIDIKRTRGIMACAECQKRKLKCDKKFPCSSCVRRGRANICPTGDMGFIGRGRRIMRSQSLELSKVIHRMGNRIHELETAVAHAHADSSDSTHPLLRDELLAIKSTNELPRSSTGCTPGQSATTSGALAVNASGTPHYFGFGAGPSALFSLQGSNGADHAEYAPPFANTVQSFPLDCDASWDTGLCLKNLIAQLPDESRAWALYDIFVADASWYGTPLMSDELHELLTLLYDPNPDLPEPLPHTLAMIFLAFAHAALVDLSMPAYSSEADTYLDLGRTALMLKSVFESDELHTIQALALAGLYYATGGPRYSLESSWTMTSLAVSLTQKLRLHRESEHTRFDSEIAQRRRALFWEMYSLETYQALSFSRPLTILLTDISCEFPADPEKEIDSEGNVIPGCFRTKCNFTKEVTAPMAQLYTSAKSPTYEEVLDLDRRLRQFMERAPFSHYHEKAREANTFQSYVRAHMIPRFAANLMLYIHRGSFIQALKDHPLNPLDGPYAASFLAAYRGASLIISSDMKSFSLFPEHFHRWWPIWKSLVNASFIVGSIVAKSPTAVMAPAAFSELLAAVDLVGRGATHCFVAAGSLHVLRRLQNKASEAYTALFPLEAPLHTNSFGLADEKDFELLSGSHPILKRDAHPKPSLPPTSSLEMSSFVPSAAPAPTTADPWANQLPDPWLNFPFTPVAGGNILPVVRCHTLPPHSKDRATTGLEAYLDAQMQMQAMSPFPSEYHRGATPTSEAEWASFLSIFEY